MAFKIRIVQDEYHTAFGTKRRWVYELWENSVLVGYDDGYRTAEKAQQAGEQDLKDFLHTRNARVEEYVRLYDDAGNTRTDWLEAS